MDYSDCRCFTLNYNCKCNSNHALRKQNIFASERLQQSDLPIDWSKALYPVQIQCAFDLISKMLRLRKIEEYPRWLALTHKILDSDVDSSLDNPAQN